MSKHGPGSLVTNTSNLRRRPTAHWVLPYESTGITTFYISETRPSFAFPTEEAEWAKERKQHDHAPIKHHKNVADVCDDIGDDLSGLGTERQMAVR
eukprot:1577026-Pyramimonas_sp.AAC.1